MKGNDLADVERRAFRSVVDTGLWDVMLASFVAMFAIAPLLSSQLGDFWSSAIFVPVWGAIYLVLRWVKERVVAPRVGVVRFGPQRQSRLHKFGVVLAIVNTIAFVAGAVFAARSDPSAMWAYPIAFSLIVLAISSLAAIASNIPRLFLYGLMIAIAPAIGEWLFRNGYAAHHGYPIVFGTAAIIIAGLGLTKLTLLMQRHPPLAQQGPSLGDHD